MFKRSLRVLENKNRGEGITTRTRYAIRSALVSEHMRAELGKYFTITAKSIKMKRNNVAKDPSRSGTCARVRTRSGRNSGCDGNFLPSCTDFSQRPRSEANPGSGGVVAETRPA